MIVYRTRTDLAQHLETLRKQGKGVGLVPTMGALHKGHTSLVGKASEENDVVVVSLFVNPAQFNNSADLEKYPRTLDKDLELLQSMKVDMVFVPSIKEMYPEEDSRTFDLGNLDRVMEGKFREGHFDRLAGTDELRKLLLSKNSPEQIYINLQIGISGFIKTRDKYLLYK
jgi:pantoate--beta-alanine ligase